MTVGFSLFLIAVGAIIRWGVTAVVEGANLDMIGLILMVIGAIGLLIGLFVGGIPGRTTREERVVDRRDA